MRNETHFIRSPQTLSKHGLYIFISEQVVLCLKVNRDKGIVRIFLLLSHGVRHGGGNYGPFMGAKQKAGYHGDTQPFVLICIRFN
ncbi:hypothetical protein BAZO_20418 [Schinkia azotoformans LMG 9581]|uniref:Uncharacterized protein n=1 Tax=Schinkia azotoformans LMG 9581 TaxID=1131731 RepID=K6D3H7_SCHAZ|nr:hypothetical protein BAZO_20418 [Schinkia azotoformans LMG 9581]